MWMSSRLNTSCDRSQQLRENIPLISGVTDLQHGDYVPKKAFELVQSALS